MSGRQRLVWAAIAIAALGPTPERGTAGEASSSIAAGADGTLAGLGAKPPSMAGVPLAPGGREISGIVASQRRAHGQGLSCSGGCPGGSFPDLGRCWKCPAGFRRTLEPVASTRACAVTRGPTYGRAIRQGPSGCRSPAFADLGWCWKCPTGFTRTWSRVDARDACRRGGLFGPVARASRLGKAGCGHPAFPDGGQCWRCPGGSVRTASPVQSTTACSVPARTELRRASFVSTIRTVKPVTPCGNADQRACCVGEAPRSCSRGLAYVSQQNSGQCRGSLLQSDGKCVAVTPCGQVGQRACCDAEGPFRCAPGLREEVRPNSGYCAVEIADRQSNGVCVAKARVITPCGGDGQRACCRHEAPFGACRAGLHELESPNAGWCKGGAFQSNGICRRSSPCGHLGERACCRSEGRNCQSGLLELAGCNGECACPDGFSNGMCTRSEKIPEPGTGWSAPPRAAGGLKGYAELHMHLFAHMANGGRLLHGEPYHAKGVNYALRNCVAEHGGAVAPHVALLNDASSIGGGLNDMRSLTGRAVDSNGGAPAFNGWPTWHSTIHQQAYYKWIERAWRGGLRLMVALAVTNEALCRTMTGPTIAAPSRVALGGALGVNCEDSMSFIDKQIAATEAMERFIASRGGWFQIVRTPQEARQVIAQGKLAVVQGIEVDNLFNCKLGNKACTATYVKAKIDEYYRKGVRHIFPIHNFDNAFGGPAAWQDAIELGNRVVEGAWWKTENCPSGYGFKLGQQDFVKFVMNRVGFGGVGVAPPHGEVASCNANSLTPLGETLIKAMIEKGMIIDVDHMSNRSLTRTLELCESFWPAYPVVASHVQLFDLNQQAIRHERMRTKAQLQRIARSGGMIAAMLKDDFQDTGNIGKQLNLPYGSSVANDCRHSSKTWAQMLQYAVDVMGGPVAVGSDFNGSAGHLGPRFGSDACGAHAREQRAQRQRLPYPFELPGFGRFVRQRTGHRTFDFNVDGLAHVGLLPDLIADLSVVGLPKKYTDSLFASAQKYIQVWELAMQPRTRSPVASAPGPTTPYRPAAGDTNVARGKPAKQSSTGWGGIASRAVDGLTSGNWHHRSVTHTQRQAGAWWEVDLGRAYPISRIEVYNRTDDSGAHEPGRLSNFEVVISGDGVNYQRVHHEPGQAAPVTTLSVLSLPRARYVRVRLLGIDYLSLAEVKVFSPGRPVALPFHAVPRPSRLVNRLIRPVARPIRPAARHFRPVPPPVRAVARPFRAWRPAALDRRQPARRPLKLFWGRKDNFTIATAEGERAAVQGGYRLAASGAGVFTRRMPGTVPLKLFWSAARQENFTTATAAGEHAARGAGYRFVRIEGYVYPSARPGTVPLKLFWSPARQDNLTTFTPQGERDARRDGYVFIRIEGYAPR